MSNYSNGPGSSQSSSFESNTNPSRGTTQHIHHHIHGMPPAGAFGFQEFARSFTDQFLDDGDSDSDYETRTTRRGRSDFDTFQSRGSDFDTFQSRGSDFDTFQSRGSDFDTFQSRGSDFDTFQSRGSSDFDTFQTRGRSRSPDFSMEERVPFGMERTGRVSSFEQWQRQNGVPSSRSPTRHRSPAAPMPGFNIRMHFERDSGRSTHRPRSPPPNIPFFGRSSSSRSQSSFRPRHATSPPPSTLYSGETRRRSPSPPRRRNFSPTPGFAGLGNFFRSPSAGPSRHRSPASGSGRRRSPSPPVTQRRRSPSPSTVRRAQTSDSRGYYTEERGPGSSQRYRSPSPPPVRRAQTGNTRGFHTEERRPSGSTNRSNGRSTNGGSRSSARPTANVAGPGDPNSNYRVDGRFEAPPTARFSQFNGGGSGRARLGSSSRTARAPSPPRARRSSPPRQSARTQTRVPSSDRRTEDRRPESSRGAPHFSSRPGVFGPSHSTHASRPKYSQSELKKMFDAYNAKWDNLSRTDKNFPLPASSNELCKIDFMGGNLRNDNNWSNEDIFTANVQLMYLAGFGIPGALKKTGDTLGVCLQKAGFESQTQELMKWLRKKEQPRWHPDRVNLRTGREGRIDESISKKKEVVAMRTAAQTLLEKL